MVWQRKCPEYGAIPNPQLASPSLECPKPKKAEIVPGGCPNLPTFCPLPGGRLRTLASVTCPSRPACSSSLTSARAPGKLGKGTGNRGIPYSPITSEGLRRHRLRGRLPREERETSVPDLRDRLHPPCLKPETSAMRLSEMISNRPVNLVGHRGSEGNDSTVQRIDHFLTYSWTRPGHFCSPPTNSPVASRFPSD